MKLCASIYSVIARLRKEGWDKYLDKIAEDQNLVLKAIPAICTPEELMDHGESI